MSTQAEDTPPTLFGQYSLVIYLHPLRGERVNLGVLVWHPFLGHDLRFTKSLQRVRCIDEAADLDRLRSSLDRIRETVKGWSSDDRSPLTALAAEFRHSLVVLTPQNARVCSPSSTLERLYSSLICSEPFMRASSTRQFANAFASRIKSALRQKGVRDPHINFDEEETFQPVKVAAYYRRNDTSYLWRAFSFAALKPEQQLQAAKAVHAENEDLKALRKYNAAHLRVAVQLPKPDARADWERAAEWLKREAERVEVFEDRQSLDEKVGELVDHA